MYEGLPPLGESDDVSPERGSATQRPYDAAAAKAELEP
jgi:hypothetical protein